MFVEYQKVRQEPGRVVRRWFEDAGFDLVVWYEPVGALAGFQIIYPGAGAERALTWREGHGFEHSRVDGGDESPLKNLTPILIPEGAVPWEWLRREFAGRSGDLEPSLRAWIAGRLEGRR